MSAATKPHPLKPAVIDNSDVGHGDFEKNACIVFVAVVPVFITARFYSRIIAKQLGVDDWASLGAFVSSKRTRQMFIKTRPLKLELTDDIGIHNDVQWSDSCR